MADIYNPLLHCGDSDSRNDDWSRKEPEGCRKAITEGESFVKINGIYYCDYCTKNLAEISKRLIPA